MATIDDQIKAALANVPTTGSSDQSQASGDTGPSSIDDQISAAMANVPGKGQASVTPSTLGYIGGAAMDSAANSGMASFRGDPEEAMTEMFMPEKNRQFLDTVRQTDPSAALNTRVFGAPNIAPPNDVARYGGAAAGAVAANPALAAFAPAATIAGGVGSESASDFNKATGEHLPDWLARLFGGAVGGAGYGVGKSAVTGASRLAGSAERAPGIAAAESDMAATGAKPVVASDLTGGDLSAGDQFAGKASGAVRGRVAEQTDALRQRAEQVLANADPQDAGKSILDGRDAWRKDFAERTEQDYAAATAKNDPTTNIDTSPVIAKLSAPTGLSPDVAENAVPSVLDKFKQYFMPDGGKPIVSRSLADMDAIRKQIGRAVANTAEPADRQALGQLYDTVADTIGDGLTAAGNEEGAAAWNQARANYAAGKNFDAQVLAPFDGKNPEQAFQFATAQLGKGNSRIATLAEQQPGQAAPVLNPEQQANVLGAYLRNRASGANNQLDVDKLNALLQNRTKQLAPQALDTLTAGFNPEQRANLEQLGRVMDRTQAARTAFGADVPETHTSGWSHMAGPAGAFIAAHELGVDPLHALGIAAAAPVAKFVGGQAARGVGNLMTTPMGAALRANMPNANLLANGAIGGLQGEGAADQGSHSLPGVPMPSYGGDSDSHAAFGDWLNSTDPHVAALHLGQRLGPTVFRELSAAANKGPDAWNQATFQLLSRPDYRKLLAGPESSD